MRKLTLMKEALLMIMILMSIRPYFRDFRWPEPGVEYSRLYDKALDEACRGANNSTRQSTAAEIVGMINERIKTQTSYHPGQPLEAHPLKAYSEACLCADMAALLQGLCRSVGIDAFVLYVWAGPNKDTQGKYVVNSQGDQGEFNPTFRVIRGPRGIAPANLHFTYHAVVSITADRIKLYDPTYGREDSSVVFDETANDSAMPQQVSTLY